MPWLRLDDGFAENPKIAELSDRSFRVHVTALCYCARNLTDGKLNGRQLQVVAAIVGYSIKRYVNELVAYKLWRNLGEGCYEINDWQEFNDPSEVIKKKRADLAEKRREAGRKGALARWGDGKDGKSDSNADGNSHMALAMEFANGPTPTDPIQQEIQTLGSDFHFFRLAKVMTDADALTVKRLRKLVTKNRLTEQDFDLAIRAASKAGVKSPSGCVIQTLRNRIEERAA